MSSAGNLAGNKKRQISELLWIQISAPGNWTGDKRNQRKTSLEIMMELDPVDGVQTGTSPKFNDQTRSSRRETQKNKP